MKKEETIKAFPSQIFQKTKHSWTEHQRGIKVSDLTDKYLFFLKVEQQVIWSC